MLLFQCERCNGALVHGVGPFLGLVDISAANVNESGKILHQFSRWSNQSVASRQRSDGISQWVTMAALSLIAGTHKKSAPTADSSRSNQRLIIHLIVFPMAIV